MVRACISFRSSDTGNASSLRELNGTYLRLTTKRTVRIRLYHKTQKLMVHEVSLNLLVLALEFKSTVRTAQLKCLLCRVEQLRFLIRTLMTTCCIFGLFFGLLSFAFAEVKRVFLVTCSTGTTSQTVTAEYVFHIGLYLLLGTFQHTFCLICLRVNPHPIGFTSFAGKV